MKNNDMLELSVSTESKTFIQGEINPMMTPKKNSTKPQKENKRNKKKNIKKTQKTPKTNKQTNKQIKQTK